MNDNKFKILTTRPVPQFRFMEWTKLILKMNFGNCIEVYTNSQRCSVISAMNRLSFTSTSRKIGKKIFVWKTGKKDNPLRRRKTERLRGG